MGHCETPSTLPGQRPVPYSDLHLTLFLPPCSVADGDPQGRHDTDKYIYIFKKKLAFSHLPRGGGEGPVCALSTSGNLSTQPPPSTQS